LIVEPFDDATLVARHDHTVDVVLKKTCGWNISTIADVIDEIR